MSIRVQCGGCGSVMNVRDDYAGTRRRCPKCKGEFEVPALKQARGVTSASGGASDEAKDEGFDPVAFLTGEKPSAKKRGSAPEGTADRTKPEATPAFDPMDVLSGGGLSPKPWVKPTSGQGQSEVAAKSPAKPSAPADDEFDPLDVLGEAPKKPAAPSQPAPPAPPPPAAVAPAAAPEKPQPRRPSWARPQPEPEKRDWEDTPAAAAEAPAFVPPAAPEQPQPRRPSWAKAAPEPEKNDWDNPPTTEPNAANDAPSTTVEAPQPKRPSWAKPLPGEDQPAAKGKGVAADASPAAQAAAAAMSAGVAEVSEDNPALQAKAARRPLFDRARIVAWFRYRTPLLIRTAIAAVVLFGVSWMVVQPRRVEWKVIGKNDRLTPVPVSGRVTVDGKPVGGARVMFHPSGTPYRSSEGETDSDGSFALRFCEGWPGAPAGRYRVELQLINKDGSDAGIAAADLLREKIYEVPDGGGTVDIELQTKKR